VATPNDRRAAVEAVKKVYNLRSRVLHGDSLTATTDAVWSASDTLIGVLNGTLEWLLWADRAGLGTEDKDGLFSQLEDALLSGKRLVAIPEHFAQTVLPELFEVDEDKS
jgi:hypothetical protein